MKGILIKDLYVAAKQCRYMLVSPIVFVVISVFGKNAGTLFFAAFASLLMSMFPMTVMSFDERSRWDVFSIALPYKRSDMVLSKYVLSMAGNVAASVLYFVICLIVNVGSWDIGFYFSMAVISASLGFIYTAIAFPPIFKMGVEKGRIWYLISIAAISAIGGGIAENASGLFTPTTEPIPMENLSGGLIAFPISIILVVISAMISIKFYENREF